MSDNQFSIDFYLDGKDFAYRSLPAIPRIGDRVAFHRPDHLVEIISYEVIGVTWGVDPDATHTVPINVHLTAK